MIFFLHISGVVLIVQVAVVSFCLFRMVFCRINAEGYDGRFVRNHMMIRFWEDVDVKAKKMGVSLT